MQGKRHDALRRAAIFPLAEPMVRRRAAIAAPRCYTAHHATRCAGLCAVHIEPALERHRSSRVRQAARRYARTASRQSGGSLKTCAKATANARGEARGAARGMHGRLHQKSARLSARASRYDSESENFLRERERTPRERPQAQTASAFRVRRWLLRQNVSAGTQKGRIASVLPSTYRVPPRSAPCLKHLFSNTFSPSLPAPHAYSVQPCPVPSAPAQGGWLRARRRPAQCLPATNAPALPRPGV